MKTEANARWSMRGKFNDLTAILKELRNKEEITNTLSMLPQEWLKRKVLQVFGKVQLLI